MANSVLLWLLLIVPIAMQVPLLLYAMRHIKIEEEPMGRQSEDIWGHDGLQRWNEVRPDRAATATTPLRCRSCGSENEPGYRFCGSCVARL